jgi:hypothetical protein
VGGRPRLAVVHEADDEVVIAPPRLIEATADRREERGPGLIFVSVPEAKTVKNRLHIDLAASGHVAAPAGIFFFRTFAGD